MEPDRASASREVSPTSPLARRSALRHTPRALVAIVLALLVYARYVEPNLLRVQRDTFTGTGLPPLDLAVIADLHHGVGAVDDAKVEEVVRVTNGLGADVIVLLGDYHATSPLASSVAPERTARLLSRLHARRGVYAVLGNHDNWLDGPRTERAFTAAGITVIENRGALVPGTSLWIAGLCDDFSSLPDPHEALRGAPMGAPVLAITHSPDVFPRLPSRFGLTLAAHTHGGQIRLPYIGSPWIPSHLGSRYARGHFVEGGRHLYVSSGVGTSILPLRFGVVPEINLVRLR